MQTKELGSGSHPNHQSPTYRAKWILAIILFCVGAISFDFATERRGSTFLKNSVQLAKTLPETLPNNDTNEFRPQDEEVTPQSKSGDETVRLPKIIHSDDDGVRIPSEKERAYYLDLRENVSISRASEGPDSITYYGCCGLGHRSTRMSAVYHLSQLLNLTHMHGRWGSCGDTDASDDEDLFAHMFGKGPIAVEPPLWTDEIKKDIQQHLKNSNIQQYLSFHEDASNFPTQFNNEVEGYDCGIESVVKYDFFGKHLSDAQFFHQLRALFRFNEDARNFLASNDLLHSPLVNGAFVEGRKVMIGLHLRTGNGESDFVEKRVHFSLEEWTSNFARIVTQLVNQKYPSRKVALFVATDSPTPVDMIKKALSSENIEVLSFEQKRIPDGEGTPDFYEFSGETDCLQNWVDQFIDSTLLASSEVIVTSSYSTFSQSYPLSTLFFDSMTEGYQKANVHSNSTLEEKNGYRRLFCELGAKADVMGCFDDIWTWAMTEWDNGRPASDYILNDIFVERGVEFFGNTSSPILSHGDVIMMPCA